MAHKTEFMAADFVILKVVKTWKITSFFKKNNFFLPWQNFANAE